MNFKIRKYESHHRNDFFQMMKEFFASPAVLHNVPEAHFQKTLQELEKVIKENPNVKRFRLETEPENEAAVKLYKKLGFKPLGYNQFTLDR